MTFLFVVIGPGHLLGDSGYACDRRCLTPYRKNQVLNPAQDRYQRAHTHTRVLVEQTFGVLKRRFGLLHEICCFRPGRVGEMVSAAAVLHNFAIEQRDELLASIQPRRKQIHAHNPPDLPPPPDYIRDQRGLNGLQCREAFVVQYYG